MPTGKDAASNMVATRMTLPATRESLTHKFSIGGHEGYLTIGLHEDGRPGEVFLKISKEGSTISGLPGLLSRVQSRASTAPSTRPSVGSRACGSSRWATRPTLTSPRPPA